MTNPMFTGIKSEEVVYANDNCATYKGITIKTISLLLLTILSGITSCVLMWKSQNIQTLSVTLLPLVIVGFISAMIGRVNPKASFVCSIIYAISEGAFLGVISLIGELYYEGVAIAAAISTIVAFVSTLGLFASGIIRNKSKIVSFGLSLGMSLVILTLVMVLLSFIPQLSQMFNHVGIIIGIEALFLIYACISLMINFVEAQTLVKGGVGKEYEWTCAFGLLISILYIYLELLRFLMIIYNMFDRR